MDTYQKSTPSWKMHFCARYIDYALFYFLGSLFSVISPFYSYDLYFLAFGIAIPFFFIPIEALALSAWGKTPGQAFLGISIDNGSGQRLSYRDALRRALLIGRLPGVARRVPSSYKKILIATLTGVGLVLGGISGTMFHDFTWQFKSFDRNQSWVRYYDEEGGFRVDFPSDPDFQSKQLEVPNGNRPLEYNEFYSSTNNVYYSVSYMDFPGKWRWVGTKTLLKKAVDLIVQNTEKAEFVEKKLVLHRSLPAIDFVFKVGQEDVKGRLVLVENRLYKLLVHYPGALDGHVEHEQFLESFEI